MEREAKKQSRKRHPRAAQPSPLVEADEKRAKKSKRDGHEDVSNDDLPPNKKGKLHSSGSSHRALSSTTTGGPEDPEDAEIARLERLLGVDGV
jgi:hypothetical protein